MVDEYTDDHDPGYVVLEVTEDEFQRLHKVRAVARWQWIIRATRVSFVLYFVRLLFRGVRPSALARQREGWRCVCGEKARAETMVWFFEVRGVAICDRRDSVT